jgi:hypothetical protein
MIFQSLSLSLMLKCSISYVKMEAIFRADNSSAIARDALQPDQRPQPVQLLPYFFMTGERKHEKDGIQPYISRGKLHAQRGSLVSYALAVILNGHTDLLTFPMQGRLLNEWQFIKDTLLPLTRER